MTEKQMLETAQYQWNWDERAEEWSLNLFPDGEKAIYLPGKLKKGLQVLTGKTTTDVPLFIGRHKDQNVASHLLT